MSEKYEKACLILKESEIKPPKPETDPNVPLFGFEQFNLPMLTNVFLGGIQLL